MTASGTDPPAASLSRITSATDQGRYPPPEPEPEPEKLATGFRPTPGQLALLERGARSRGYWQMVVLKDARRVLESIDRTATWDDTVRALKELKKAGAVMFANDRFGNGVNGTMGYRITRPAAAMRSQASLTAASFCCRAAGINRMYALLGDSQWINAVHLEQVTDARGSDKMRFLGIPAMIIRAQQALHLQGLEPVAETRADPHPYGFRRSRGTQDAIARVFNLLAQKDSAPWIFEGDIKGCFDNFGHGWLEDHVPMNKKVLSDWLKAGYVESGKLFPTEAGTPQGGIASPTIANIALDGLEAVLAERFGRTQSSITRFRVRLVRYADDFIITGSSKELLEKEVKPCVEAFLAERGLQLSQEKTTITHISGGFNFLGQNVREYGGKLLIKPSAKNVKAFLDSVRETIRVNRSVKQETLIDLLNPKIRGWANYHRHVVATRTYSAVDAHIWRALWRWARRRHPKKPSEWVRKKYFRTLDHRYWVFATQTRLYNGEPRLLALISASDTRIVRHVRVKSDANPFDPAWDSYFAQRKGTRMLERLKERGFPKRLWQQQKGKCSGCGQLIGEDDRWVIQPLVPFEAGGTRSLTNLKLLHSSCQRPFRIAHGKPLRGDHRVPAP